MIAYVLVRRQGYGLKEVANYLIKRDPSTVNVLIGRLAERMEKDKEIRRDIESLDKLV